MSQRRSSLNNKMDKIRNKLLNQTGHGLAEDALRRAAAILAETQRFFRLGSWDWDFAADKIQFSDEMFRLVGMAPGEVEINREVFAKFLPADEAERVLREFQESMVDPFSSIDHCLVLPNGEIRNVHTRVKAHKDENGKLLLLIGSTQDVTEQKRIEEALKESEWRTRIVSELTTDYIFVVDVEPEGLLKLRWASDNMFRMTGRTVEDAATSDMWGEIIHPQDMVSFLGFVNDVVLTAESKEFECRTFHKLGEERWVRIFARPQVGEEGRVTTIIGAIRDITEYKQEGLALRQSEAHYHFLADHMTDTIWLMDLDFKFIYVSPSVEKIRGYTFEELQQMPLEQILTPASLQLAVKIFSEEIPKVLTNPTYSPVYTMELDFFRRDGTLHSVESKVSIIRSENGDLISIMGQDRDIMERKRTERERQALLEIMLGTVSTNDMREFLELIRLSINKVICAENYSVVLYDKETGLFEEVYVIDKYDAPMHPSKLEKSITAHVFRTAEALLLDQDRFDELEAQGLVTLVGTNSACWLGAPLRTSSETFGVIAVQDYENRNCYSDRDKDFLSFIGTQVALAIERKHAQDNLLYAKESLRTVNLELQHALIREQRISRTDSLTNTHNRRYFFEFADHEFSVAKRYGKPLSMIMFDIDHFKGFNDMYGHQAGDDVLKCVTQIAEQQLRDADILARYGGEEFVILLPNTGIRESAIVAERIRESVAAFQLVARGNRVSVTISVGVAECVESTGTLDQLVQQTDRAMYTAKEMGRNCVAFHSV